MRRLIAAALGGAMVLSLAACGSSGGGATDGTPTGSTQSGSTPTGSSGGGPITIGQIASLTGPYTPLGSNDKIGAEQAVAEINGAGGVLGRKIKLVVDDDQTKPDQAVIDFNKLVSGGAVAVIGSPMSNATLAVMPIAERKKIPVVSTAAADQQVEPVKPYIFMTPPTARVAAEQLLRYFKAQGYTKMAVAYDSANSFAKSGWQVMSDEASKYGISWVDKETFETSTTNFSPILTHVRSSGAQALMVWATGAPSVGITKQFASAKMGMPLIMSHAEGTPLYTKPAGAAAVGVTVATSLAVVGPQLPASAVKDSAVAFINTFKKNNNGSYPPQFAFDGYIAVKMIAAAITKANSTDPQKIRDALDTLTLVTPEGKYQMSGEDHSGLSVDDIVITTVQSDGTFKPTQWSMDQLSKTLGK